MLIEWNKKINLIQKNTMTDIVKRHIEDSEQICKMLNFNDDIIDIGSGAGFPGVILAINNFKNVVLCEKNNKKVAFLHVIKNKLNINFSVFAEDVYNFNRKNFVSVSRAFGSLSKLLDVMLSIDSKKGVFHKGKKYKEEIKEALKSFEFDYEIIQSITNKCAAIIIVKNIKRKIWEE
jgi:16S rRNA (guanine527-N7)-methyltransferase